MEKYNQNKIDFLKEKASSLVLISKDKNLLDTLSSENDIEIYLIDDLESLNGVGIYSELIKKINKVFVFVNSSFEENKFLQFLVNRTLNVFEKEKIFCDIIVYPKYDFPKKESLKKISMIKLFNRSNIELDVVDSVYYVGQYGTSGYASAAKGYVAEYVTNGIPVCWHTLKFDSSKLDTTNYVNALAESAINRTLSGKDQITLHSTPDLWPEFIRKYECSKYKRVVGYCAWESSKLPSKWVDCINMLPEVWVPSHYNKTVYENCGVKSKIEVVPHVWFDQKLLSKNKINITDCFGTELSKSKYTFYCIGELTARKSIEELVKVFDKLNDKYQDTQLLLKVHYKDYTLTNINYIVNKLSLLTNKLGKSIHLLLMNLNEREMLSLHSFGDCYVSLTKSEGFGLTIFEAFHLKKDVIATGYSGHIDFLGENHPGLVNYKIGSIQGMETFSVNYTSDQEWAYPDLDHTYALMESKVK
jgi:glycosyltransferase involved in cell wall biosynthesis